MKGRCGGIVSAGLALAACSSEKPATAPPTAGSAGSGSGGSAGSAAPARDAFLTFATDAPAVGDPAPGFTLTSTTGATVELAAAVRGGPVVLVFASFTCPPSRMKLPGFEALAARWRGAASVLVVYVREAHARAKSSERLNGFADQVYARDADGDGAVTLAEYAELAPRYMFDAFDLDHDGEVRSYELLAARRLEQFRDVEAPATFDDRVAIARKLRADVPGEVPMLVDGIDDAVATAYGGLPNMAYVIGADGKVAFKLPWAAVGDVERELARLVPAGPVPQPVRSAPALDLAVVKPHLDAARAAKRPLLLELTALGCKACTAMAATLAAPDVTPALARYHVAAVGIEHDAAWKLFESLALGATPALVAMSPDGTVLGTLQGARDAAAVREFLDRHAGT